MTDKYVAIIDTAEVEILAYGKSISDREIKLVGFHNNPFNIELPIPYSFILHAGDCSIGQNIAVMVCDTLDALRNLVERVNGGSYDPWHSRLHTVLGVYEQQKKDS